MGVIINLDDNGKIGYKKRFVDKVISSLKEDGSIENIDKLLLKNRDKTYFINYYLIENFGGETKKNLETFIEKTNEDKIFFKGEWL